MRNGVNHSEVIKKLIFFPFLPEGYPWLRSTPGGQIQRGDASSLEIVCFILLTERLYICQHHWGRLLECHFSISFNNGNDAIHQSLQNNFQLAKLCIENI